jgi:hypothetical protein
MKSSPYWLISILACCFALLLAACGPSATPTPTARPTEPPTEVEEEVETEAADVEADETEPADEADATEAAEASSGDEATEAASGDEGDEATEAAEGTSEAGGSAASGEGFTATVNVSTVRVREEPAVSAAIVQEITRGTVVTVMGQTADGGYVQVQLEDGTEGWVAKQTLAFEDPRVELPVVTP